MHKMKTSKEQQMQYDNSKSKIHKYQRRLLSGYGCKLDIHDTFKLLMLRKEFLIAEETLFRFTKGNHKTYGDYVNKCNAVIKEATSLGLEVTSKPTRKLRDIKTELIKLLGIGGLTETGEINQLLIAMKMIDVIKRGNQEDTTFTYARLPINEKQRLADVKESQLQKKLIAAGVADEDWLDLEDCEPYEETVATFDDEGEIIGHHEKDQIKDVLLQMEQQTIDKYNSQL